MHSRVIIRSVFLLLGLGLSACHQDVQISPAQSTTFIKLFGGFDTEKAYAVEQTADGGYLCLGSTNSSGNGGLDMYLIKTDKGGNTVWEKTIGQTLDDEGKALQVLADGSFVCLGDYTREDGSTDLYLVKLSSSGDILWTNTFGRADRNEKAFDLKITAAGDLLLIGNSSGRTGITDMYLVKTDAGGQLKWQKSYGLTGLHDDIAAVEETPEGNLLWCGTEFRERTGHMASDMRLILTNPEGDILWDKTFGTENPDRGADILLKHSGYIGLGTTRYSQEAETDIYLISLFQSGAVRWEQTIVKPKSSEEARSIAATNDGGYIITGSTSAAGTGNQDILLLKTDERGNKLWSKSFGGQFPDTGNQVKQTADGGYIIFGTIYFETNSMLCLVKTTAEGELDTK
jgi:hypothetical protein